MISMARQLKAINHHVQFGILFQQNGRLYAGVTRICEHVCVCILHTIALPRILAQFVMEPPQITCIFK